MKVFNVVNIEKEDLPRDEKFLRDISDIIESNLTYENLGVNELEEAMSMSRSRIYRNLKKITGKNITQFIREFRLAKAYEMLKKDVATASEIGYKVGFSSPAYFNKCFHDKYGFPPGQVTKRNPDVLYPGDHEKNNRSMDLISGWLFSKPIQKYYYLVLLVTILGLSAVIYLKAVNINTSSLSPITVKRIEVMPFQNGSNIPGNDYMCTSLRSEIIDQLLKVQNISVKSGENPASLGIVRETRKWNNKSGDVDYYLNGTLLQLTDSLKVWIQLTDSEEKIVLWTESYHLPYNTSSIFELHADIAGKVAHSLDLVISPTESKKNNNHYEADIRALELLWRGQQEYVNYWRNWETDPVHLEAAMDFYNQSLAIDPELTDALVGKGVVFRIHNDIDSALYYAKKAIELDAEQGNAYGLLAEIYSYKGNNEMSLKYYFKAIDLNPNASWYYIPVANLFIMIKGDIEKGFTNLEKCRRLDPYNESYNIQAGYLNLYLGDFKTAEAHYLTAFENAQERICISLRRYCWCKIITGDFDGGLDFLKKNCDKVRCNEYCAIAEWKLKLHQDNFEMAENIYDSMIYEGVRINAFDSVYLAHMYKQLNKVEAFEVVINHSRKTFEEMLVKHPNNINPISRLIFIYALLNEKDKMMEILSKFEETGGYYFVMGEIENSSIFDQFREDPDFKALLDRVNAKKAENIERLNAFKEAV